MTTASPDRGSAWLWGPGPDLLLGCGLLFVALAALFAATGDAVSGAVPLAVPAILIALVSMPHYGATLLRVYDRREDRRAYFFFGVVVTGLLLALFFVALRDRLTGSILATVYLTWSAWHYTGQNYGIAALLLRRRGVPVEGAVRHLMYGSFVLSFVLVFLVIHEAADGPLGAWGQVRLIPLGVPAAWNAVLVPLFVALHAATTVAWVALLARGAGGLRALAPAILIAVVQALWWTIPHLEKVYGFASEVVPLGWSSRAGFFAWIACAHAAQYLWITAYYARATERWDGMLRYYARILAAGTALWTIPALLFAPGTDELDWNFALLIAAVVNIHHFVLDGAIWKLRHMKIARVLIGGGRADDEGAANAADGLAARAAPWVRRGVWAVASLGVVLIGQSLIEAHVIEPAARRAGDWPAVAASLDRQAWLGQHSAHERFRLGLAFERAGDRAEAIRQFTISADLEPRVESIKRLIAHRAAGDLASLVPACERLYALPEVERSVPPVDPMTSTATERARYRAACLQAANRARPAAPRARTDATGGAGLDGGVRRY